MRSELEAERASLAEETASRFLAQATFGPTRAEIGAFAETHGSSPAAWVAAQMALEPTLHRAYYRARSSPHFTVAGACAKTNHWFGWS